ncbi:hypothetical protein ACWCO3_32415 [Micromonospora sp. NPDC002411]
MRDWCAWCGLLVVAARTGLARTYIYNPYATAAAALAEAARTAPPTID